MLGFDSEITDKNFPTKLLQTGFIKIKTYEYFLGMEEFVNYYPYVVTKYVLSNKHDIPFPPSNGRFIDRWKDSSFKHNHDQFLAYLHDKWGYSNEYLLINANYKEYRKNFGLKGFKIIEAVIHYLENNSFMRKKVNKINYTLPI